MTQMTVTNVPYVQSYRARLPQASLRDTLGLISTVVLPTVASRSEPGCATNSTSNYIATWRGPKLIAWPV